MQTCPASEALGQASQTPSCTERTLELTEFQAPEAPRLEATLSAPGGTRQTFLLGDFDHGPQVPAPPRCVPTVKPTARCLKSFPDFFNAQDPLWTRDRLPVTLNRAGYATPSTMIPASPVPVNLCWSGLRRIGRSSREPGGSPHSSVTSHSLNSPLCTVLDELRPTTGPPRPPCSAPTHLRPSPRPPVIFKTAATRPRLASEGTPWDDVVSLWVFPGEIDVGGLGKTVREG